MAFNTIVIKGDPIYKEYTANAAITPGHLCELMSTGKARVHATGGGSAARMFAIEDNPQGGEIDTDYTADNKAQFAVCPPGTEVNALLYNGETAVIGSKLESQGDGTLRVVDADTSAKTVIPGSIVGIALEAVDMSGSSGVDPSGRIRIEVF